MQEFSERVTKNLRDEYLLTLKPETRAIAIAEALLRYGRGDEGPGKMEAEELNEKIDPDVWFWRHEAGAVLVRELADKGFKIVKT